MIKFVFHNKTTFEKVLESTYPLNFETLVRKAQLAASIASLCPRHRRRLRQIERSVRAQMQAAKEMRPGWNC